MDIVYIYKAEAGAGLGGMRMSSHVGLRIPLYCTGVGKAILATQSYGEAERVWLSLIHIEMCIRDSRDSPPYRR